MKTNMRVHQELESDSLVGLGHGESSMQSCCNSVGDHKFIPAHIVIKVAGMLSRGLRKKGAREYATTAGPFTVTENHEPKGLGRQSRL